MHPKKSTHPRKFDCSLRGCRYPTCSGSFGSFGFQVSINQELLFKKVPSWVYIFFLPPKKCRQIYIYIPQNLGGSKLCEPYQSWWQIFKRRFCANPMNPARDPDLRPSAGPRFIVARYSETKDTKAYGIHVYIELEVYFIYIPWDSEPWKNVGCSSKPEVWKQNPRFSKFMKFDDLIISWKYQ